MQDVLCPFAKRKISDEEMQTLSIGTPIDGWATSLRGEKNVKLGKPMPMRFTRINITDKEMEYSVYDGYGLFYVRVKDAEGHILPLTPTGEISLGYKMAGFTYILQVQPGEGHEFTFDLNNFFDFKKAGDYTVEAFQQIAKPDPADPHKYKQVELLSNTLYLSVH